MRILKSILATVIFAFSLTTVSAQELPAPSPLGKIEQRVGLTDITITYSRPGVKDRTIFGDLLPYGELWRTGANAATKFETSTDLVIKGKTLPAGSYAIFTIPGKEEWTVIFNKDVNQGGTADYTEEKDALRLTVKPEAGNMRETMTFVIDNVRDNSGVIELQWEKTVVRIPFEVEYMELAKKNIEDELKKLDGVFSSYNRIARYYVDNNMNLDKALELAKKSVDMKKEFWNVYTLSLAQAANKQYKEAVKTAEMSKKLAEEAKYDVYIKRNEANIAKWKGMK